MPLLIKRPSFLNFTPYAKLVKLDQCSVGLIPIKKFLACHGFEYFYLIPSFVSLRFGGQKPLFARACLILYILLCWYICRNK